MIYNPNFVMILTKCIFKTSQNNYSDILLNSVWYGCDSCATGMRDVGVMGCDSCAMGMWDMGCDSCAMSMWDVGVVGCDSCAMSMWDVGVVGCVVVL